MAVNLDNLGSKDAFFLIAGPCVVESLGLCQETVQEIKRITDRLGIPYVFKASYRKANRSRLDSFTGIGDTDALKILASIRNEFDLPVTTDIHTEEEAFVASDYVDILQIPAFLCRQTSLLQAAAKQGKVVNIKKGQFMSGKAMRHAVKKVRETSNSTVWLTERGTTFGYQDLVVDFRNIPWMKEIGVPVIMDCTHALQKPNRTEGVTGGQPELIATMARAAIATGANGLFIETHPDPSKALSDGANMLPLEKLENLLVIVQRIFKAITIA